MAKEDLSCVILCLHPGSSPTFEVWGWPVGELNWTTNSEFNSSKMCQDRMNREAVQAGSHPQACNSVTLSLIMQVAAGMLRQSDDVDRMEDKEKKPEGDWPWYSHLQKWRSPKQASSPSSL